MEPVVRLLEKRLMTASSAGERLAALLALAQGHADDFRNREGLKAAREALLLARSRDDATALGRALAAATQCHCQRADYIAAIATAVDAVEAHAEGDVADRSRAHSTLALALHEAEAHESAEIAAEQALADAIEAGDAGCEALARDALGRVLQQAGRFHAARREFRLAAVHHRATGNLARLKKSVAGLGHCYRRQGNAMESAGARSRFYWKQALRVLAIARATGQADADDALLETAMAECHWRLEDLPSAWTHVVRALALAARIENAPIIAECHLWEAHVLMEAGELAAAEWAAGQACAAARTSPLDPIHANCLLALAAVHDAQGRFERASDVEARSREVRLERQASLALARTELGRNKWGQTDKWCQTPFSAIEKGV